jgi:3,4-dihydroxy 2-butanone 4-phosphate synthase / GTP cyclohydrolase II
MKLNTIEEAIEDIKNGKVIIVVDDEDRENEGDFVTAARNITPEIVNFMATHGRGLICAPLVEERCKELGLELMVTDNTALHATPFTVSVDLNGHGCTTGISASDRAKTIQALIDPSIKKEELGKPGHIFPLMAKAGGVLRRTGHTEAAIDLSRMAGFEPAGVLVEIMNEDGTMARLPELMVIAEKFDLKIVSIEDLVAYRMENESLIERKLNVEINTDWGNFNIVGYRQKTTGDEHIAVVKGTWSEDEPVLVRMHSTSSFADIFGSLVSQNGPLLHEALKMINKEQKGVVVYMQQEGQKQNLLDRLAAFDSGKIDTKETNFLDLALKMDKRDFGIGAQILRDLGIRKLRLISNKKQTRTGIHGYGLDIVEYVPISDN